jgi:hypothetical protein
MRKLLSFFFIAFSISGHAQKNTWNRQIAICKDLLAAICEKENFQGGDFAVENLSQKQRKMVFHCALEKIGKGRYQATIIRTPHIPDVKTQAKFTVRGIDCFFYNHDTKGPAFFMPDNENWSFLVHNYREGNLYYLLEPYTLDKPEGEFKSD